MSGWLGKLLGEGGSKLLDGVMGGIAKIKDSHLSDKEARQQMEAIIHTEMMAQMELISGEIGAKERIMVAELQQGDKYTKRARPTIVYVGLAGALIDAINYIDFTLPQQFWIAWGGVVGVYGIGRTFEKIKKDGLIGKVATVITGKKQVSSILRD